MSARSAVDSRNGAMQLQPWRAACVANRLEYTARSVGTKFGPSAFCRASFTSPRCTHAGVWCRRVRRGANHAPFGEVSRKREGTPSYTRGTKSMREQAPDSCACVRTPLVWTVLVHARSTATGVSSQLATIRYQVPSPFLYVLLAQGETAFSFKSSCSC